MREILFRGKSLCDGSWVMGDLIGVSSDFGGAFIRRKYNDSVRVNPATVGQFTGLHDKRGNKVFDGDVLKISRTADGMGTYYFPALEYPVKVFVKWDMCSWLWETCGGKKYYLHFPDAWCHFECEVIGNIHDNPELLEARDD